MRCRVSGESGKLEESMTILRRDRTSATETTSSLTTAAIRVSAPWSGTGCPGGACAGPRCAGAGSALFEKPARLISTKPNQRVIVIDEQPSYFYRGCQTLHLNADYVANKQRWHQCE